MTIDPTAIVEKGAVIGAGARIGPFCHVGPGVNIGDDCVLHAHVVVAGSTTIGPRTKIHPFASIGGPPQHVGYKNENTKLVIGAENVIREHVTMNIGTSAGRGVTIVGDRGYFMASSHVAHDCIVGDHAIFANNAIIGGHVVVEDYVFLGGMAAIHQFCRIGSYAFVGGCAAVTTDIIPYASAHGNHAALGGLNIIGMKRRGMPRETIHALRSAYRLLFAETGTFRTRLAEVEERYGATPEVERILDFIRKDSTRPLMAPHR
jgi:UDP-N-acetylglucosamine acyltransferase